MMLELDFDRVAHDFDHGRVNVQAEYDGRRVLCGVSEEALQDISGRPTFDPGELVEILQGNSDHLGALIERKYAASATEADGYILVKSSDL